MKKSALAPAPLLVLAVVSTVVCVSSLRANNVHMLKLRDAVYTADKNNNDTQAALTNLQQYVTTHMNTNLSAGSTQVYPPVQLKYTYDRLVRAQGDNTQAANAKIYNEAQMYCEAQNSKDVSGRNRVPCIEAYVQQHNPQKIQQIPDSLYKFAFATPRWSPDLAGLSMVVAALSGLAFVVSVVALRLSRKK